MTWQAPNIGYCRRHLAARGIDLRLAGARGEVQQDLIRAGFERAAVEGYGDVDTALANPQAKEKL